MNNVGNSSRGCSQGVPKIQGTLGRIARSSLRQHSFLVFIGAYKTGNISATVEGRAKAKATIKAYIKSFTGFRFPPKCMTSNDL